MARAMLARASWGLPVQTLQEYLTSLGINPGLVDGVFGPKTEAVVKRLQELQSLEVDGIVGPKTRGASPPASGRGRWRRAGASGRPSWRSR